MSSSNSLTISSKVSLCVGMDDSLFFPLREVRLEDEIFPPKHSQRLYETGREKSSKDIDPIRLTSLNDRLLAC